uniref:RNA-binding KH domain-containing protein PEPPER-like n=1 Tax=Erigeron canadensis TaxID=72917 RepID=UPI001CB9137E|nr:RNA-binding KH domain-containing protein PEPPER-like [Erigeron canadensis]
MSSVNEPTTESPETHIESPETHTESPETHTESINAAVETEQKVEPPLPEKKWPGWPGDCVFRLVVPVVKVGSIIGKKGDQIRKICEKTKACIRILNAPVSVPDRIVLISGKEDTDAPLSSAMDAVVRVFKCVNGFPENDGDGAATIPSCSIRLLVQSMQAMSLIGKQGSSIKTIQESTGCSIRVVPSEELSRVYTSSDSKIVDLQGEALKVLKALEAVLGHLRKFLVDRSVLPLFEIAHDPSATQEHQLETWAEKSLVHTGSYSRVDSPLSVKRESLYLDRESQRESRYSSSGVLYYGRETGLSRTHSPAHGRTSAFVTQVAQTMQIPLVYTDAVIGLGGRNIAYVRQTSGATLTIKDSQGLPDEMTLELKGTLSQVQTAQQLIEDFIDNHKESKPSGYGRMDPSSRSQYSDSSYSRRSYDKYRTSGVDDDYRRYRM